ncbi:hypothetical protein DACRYDRAFT_106543 [Dacryopinax primogenitus]|uniref:Uncharacterized protein n=1 Tax=Dacryopinax primogenitus (strain DJM 731) TaxID=1858805 RepID=M5G3Y2_DACPD|nr:uncharacterized protein DACRYDRAFT_106543 [Dacryopinax primogenitus]EJU03384.1 hypothetical protein DACRYDRAFT_106543 [Dacryopinax primogenitus]
MSTTPAKKMLKLIPKPPTGAQLLSGAIKIMDRMNAALDKPIFSAANGEWHRVANLPKVWLDVLPEDDREELL